MGAFCTSRGGTLMPCVRVPKTQSADEGGRHYFTHDFYHGGRSTVIGVRVYLYFTPSYR